MSKALFPTLALAALLGLSSPLVAHPVSPPATVAQEPQPTAADIARAGPLALGMTDQKVLEVLGQPQSQTQPVLSQATALFNKNWLFPDQGVTVGLSAPDLEGPYTIESLLLVAPNDYQLSAGIMIGMLQREAFGRFKMLVTEDINSLNEISDNSFGVLVMSTYTVFSVTREGAVVTQIYLGPGPE